MATLSIAVSGSGVANGTRTFSPTDADLTALINWWRATRPMSPDARTDAQVLAAWADSLVIRTRQEIRRHQQAAAAQTASDGVPGPSFPPA